jgi:WD40 repeat protein
MSNQITQEKIPSGFALRYQFTQQQGLITDITWSPDGWMLAIADSNNTVRICDADNGNTIWKLNRDSSISSGHQMRRLLQWAAATQLFGL